MKFSLKKYISALLTVALFLTGPLSAFATSYYVGDGTDGSLTFATTRTEDSVKSNITTQANSGQKDVVLNSATGFAANDWVLVIQMQGTGAGNYEFHKIASIATNTLTLKANLANTYLATGAQVIKVKQYSDVTVQSSGVWKSSQWSGTVGGVLVAMVSGNITVQSGGAITQNSNGFFGTNDAACTNDGNQGESSTGAGGSATTANGGGGGGGSHDTLNRGGSGGGGGGYGTTGTAGGNGSAGISVFGDGGGTVGGATLASGSFLLGQGGGAGGLDLNNGTCAGGGGYGGGAVLLISGGTIDVSAGSVTTTGMNGYNAHNANGNAGGGGGGSGGAVRYVTTGTLTLGTDKTTAAGGSGGSNGGGSSTGGAGGAGGSGRIAGLSGATKTGTASPTIDVTSTDTTTAVNPYATTDNGVTLTLAMTF